MLTNFNALTDEQKTAWAMETWHLARERSFTDKFLGTGQDAMIQHITELTESEKGSRAVITLVADTEGDGVAGDRTLENNEEEIKSYDAVIQVDQLRQAHRHKGTMADQKSVVTFRKEAKSNLAYWWADRRDQMAFQTLAGVSYSLRPNGAARGQSELPFLDFAGDVTAPTARRVLNWNGTTISSSGTTAAVTATDTPSWEMFVQMKAYAEDEYIRALGGEANETFYNVFLTPQAGARLKLDPSYVANLRHAQPRDMNNPLFTGAFSVIDNLIFRQFRHVPNSSGLTSGTDQWGSGLNVEGCQVLMCGAQALGMADIGSPGWNEKGFDYDNQQGIKYGGILGFLKPQFIHQYANNTLQDYGVLSCYVSQEG
jgi:N4-gp56 family major capsid protein